MKKAICILIVTGMFIFTGCEPGVEDELNVFNQSDKKLTIKYCSDKKLEGSANCDTITQTISPNSNLILKTFTARQRAKKFYCCPCEIGIHSITSIYGPIKKDPAVSANWLISNKNKLRNRASGPTAKCEFYITTGDL